MRKPPTGRAALARAFNTALLALALVAAYAAGMAKGSGTEPHAAQAVGHVVRVAASCPPASAPAMPGYAHSRSIDAPTGPIPLAPPFQRERAARDPGRT